MRAFIALLAVAVMAASRLHAQSAPPPRITVVMPPGAKAGDTVEVTVTGQDLGDVEGLYFSFPGAKVEVLSAAKAPVDPKAKPGGKPPPPATNQKFKVAVPGNAPLGTHDIRVITKGGVSNPRAFVVGDLREVVEKEPNDDVPVAQKIDLNTTVNGVIGANTDVDYFVFAGKKGQRVVVSCLTTSIDSKLPALVQVFSRPQEDLFRNQKAHEIAALRRDAAGYPLANAIIDAAERRAAKGEHGSTALLGAVTDGLIIRAASANRSVEEHYYRESTAPRSVHVRDRLQGALAKAALSSFAAHRLNMDGASKPSRISKQSGLDDGVSLE